MKIKLNSNYIVGASMVITPVLLAFLSHIFFNNSYNKVNKGLATKIGHVAGASVKKQIKDISKILPIIPNAEISNVDTSHNRIYVILETDQPESEVKRFYDDYLFINNWKEVNENEYYKDGKKLRVKITDTIVKLELTSEDNENTREVK